MKEDLSPVLMTEDYWANTQLSIVRHTGSVRVWGHEYTIVDRLGRTVFDVSIPPGASADLVRTDFIPLYGKVGRDVFLDTLKANPSLSGNKLKARFREILEERRMRKLKEIADAYNDDSGRKAKKLIEKWLFD